MMKIETSDAGGRMIVKVEGRLAGIFVPELEHCWRSARAEQPGRPISIDLQSVTCVDLAGRRLLQLMHADGVAFLRARLAIQDILEQITAPCHN